MTTSSMRLSAMLVFALLFAMPNVADAYVCTRTDPTGPSVAWDTRSVGFVLGQKNGQEVNLAEMDAALRFALAQWNGVACSDFEMTVEGATDDLRGGFDWAAGAGQSPNTNLIVFRGDDASSLTDTWLHEPTAIAITTATYVRQSGRIVDADIELNDVAFVFSACDPQTPGCIIRNDLKNTLTHEVGHALGLDHTLDGEVGGLEATMYRRAPEGDVTKRDLSENDEQGICFLYPRQGATGECYGVPPEPSPPIFVTASCASTGAESSATWALLLLAGLGANRRRRHVARCVIPPG